MSEIVAYAIMIAIAIGLATAVFGMWKYITDGMKPAIDCKDGTSINLEDYSCASNTLTLTIKNNGGFNVNGVIVKVSNDSAKEPTIPFSPYPVDPLNNLPGYYQFSPVLKPEDTPMSIKFTNTTSVKKVSYQPYIFDTKSNKKVVCQGTVPVIPTIGHGCS